MEIFPFKQVDVFTQRPFWGNPVAVVIGAEGLTTEEMQRIAAWTNLSETTFVLPPPTLGADYRLRIFTTKQELPFAGHPTIGSAHAVIESGYAAAKNGKLRQECLAGILDLAIEELESGRQIFVQAPKAKITPLSKEQAAEVSAALGASCAENQPLRIDIGVVWLVADMGDATTVASLQPDMGAVAKLSAALNTTGITVFGRAHDGKSSLHARSFAPLQGVPEDPVCGSGNAGIAAYLIHGRNLSDYGSKYIARQGMQVGREGQVTVRVVGESVEIGGYAVTCVDGNLRRN